MNLIDQARQRKHWTELTPRMQERIEQVLNAAQAPDLGIIATDNQALRQQLGYSPDQWRRINQAMKRARLLDVQRHYSRDVNGALRDQRPSSWIYCYDDAPRQSQIPRRRRGQDEVKVRRLESQVGVLEDELRRLQSALLRQQQGT